MINDRVKLFAILAFLTPIAGGLLQKLNHDNGWAVMGAIGGFLFGWLAFFMALKD